MCRTSVLQEFPKRSTIVIMLAGGALRNKFYILEYVDHCGYIRKADGNVVEEFPGIELDHRHTGRLSTAMTKPFEKVPMRLFLAGLFGCVSLVVVSEMGVWFSHHWEAPSFLGNDHRFEREVLSTIRDGDLEDPIRMPGPIPLRKVGHPKYSFSIIARRSTSGFSDFKTVTFHYQTRCAPSSLWTVMKYIDRI